MKEKIKPKIWPYFAEKFYRVTKDPRKIQSILGHKRFDTTCRYIRPFFSNEEQEKDINATARTMV